MAKMKEIIWYEGMGMTKSLHGFIDNVKMCVLEEPVAKLQAQGGILCYAFGGRFEFDSFEQAKEQIADVLAGYVTSFFEDITINQPDVSNEGVSHEGVSQPDVSQDDSGVSEKEVPLIREMTKAQLVTYAKETFGTETDWMSMTKAEIISALEETQA